MVVFDDSGKDPDFQLDPVALSVPPPLFHALSGIGRTVRWPAPVCSGAWLFRRLAQALLLNPN